MYECGIYIDLSAYIIVRSLPAQAMTCCCSYSHFFFSLSFCIIRLTPFIFLFLWSAWLGLFHNEFAISCECIFSLCFHYSRSISRFMLCKKEKRRELLFLIFTFPWALHRPLVNQYMECKLFFTLKFKIQCLIYFIEVSRRHRQQAV